MKSEERKPLTVEEFDALMPPGDTVECLVETDRQEFGVSTREALLLLAKAFGAEVSGDVAKSHGYGAVIQTPYGPPVFVKTKAIEVPEGGAEINIHIYTLGKYCGTLIDFPQETLKIETPEERQIAICIHTINFALGHMMEHMVKMVGEAGVKTGLVSYRSDQKMEGHEKIVKNSPIVFSVKIATHPEFGFGYFLKRKPLNPKAKPGFAFTYKWTQEVLEMVSDDLMEGIGFRSDYLDKLPAKLDALYLKLPNFSK